MGLERSGNLAPRLFASFSSDELLRESGRLPFAVLYPFVRAGHEVWVHSSLKQRLMDFYRLNRGQANFPETARLSLSMPGVRFTGEIPERVDEWTYLFDQPLVAATGRRWRRRLQIRSDLFSPYWLRAPLIAPYAMHPSQSLMATHQRLHCLRLAPRAMRVLFAGDSKDYIRNRVRYPGPKLSRLEVLTTLKEQLGDAVVQVSGADEISRLCDAGFVNRFVLSDSGSGIEPVKWLPTLARADLFLCPPGMVMPMCHNVIEAMAVGTIPLIGYPEWFHPNLQHMRNCVVFGGRDDLVEKMRMVLAMPQPQIERMRAEVIDYYERYLRPETLVDAIEARPERDLTVLIYTELNMARNEKKLNRRSVLMRGPSAPGPLRWIGRLLDGRAAA